MIRLQLDSFIIQFASSICRCTVETHSENIEDVDDNEDVVEDLGVQTFDNEKTAEKCFFFFFCHEISTRRKFTKIFCRRIKNKTAFLSTVNQYATELNDLVMLQNIADELKTESQLCYHASSKLKYFSKYQSFLKKPDTTDWATTRDFNKLAREQLLLYIEEEVLTNLKILTFKFIEKFLH